MVISSCVHVMVEMKYQGGYFFITLYAPPAGIQCVWAGICLICFPIPPSGSASSSPPKGIMT